MATAKRLTKRLKKTITSISRIRAAQGTISATRVLCANSYWAIFCEIVPPTVDSPWVSRGCSIADYSNTYRPVLHETATFRLHNENHCEIRVQVRLNLLICWNPTPKSS